MSMTEEVEQVRDQLTDLVGRVERLATVVGLAERGEMEAARRLIETPSE